MSDIQETAFVKHKAFTSLFFFTKHILGYDLLTGIHRDLCDYITDNTGDLLDLEPRDHFKTSCITIGYSIWMIVKNPDIRILISHKTLKKAKEILREIKEHFEQNEKLRYYFGDQIGSTWKTDEIIVSSRTKNYKEPTIGVGSIDHAVASSHFDLIINDDLVGLEDMYSEAARESTARYYKSLKYLRDKRTFLKVITIGTRWHLFDLYQHIIDKKLATVRIRQAIDDDDNVYFPERYSKDDLDKMRTEDPVIFESQMMNNPTAMEDQLYKIEKLQFYDYEKIKTDYHIGYVDPAFGRSERGDPCYFCFVVLAVNGAEVFVREWIVNKLQPEDNEKLVIGMVADIGIRQLGIESNAGQGVWAKNVQKGLRLAGQITGVDLITHSTNKNRRIQGMHGSVVNSVYFRKDWEQVYPEAMKQLLLYPYYKFNDAPDALEGGVAMVIGKKRLQVF